MKIVFTGAQGVGKTTLMDIIDKCFTLPMPFNIIRNSTRNIAKTGLKINENGDERTQSAIMHFHQTCANRTDNIIMDRCALDGMVYTEYLYRRGKVSEQVYMECMNIFKQCMPAYDIIYYLVPEFPITGDSFRSSNKQYQQDIAAIFEEYIKKYNINVIKLTGTVGDRLKTVQETLGGIIKC